MRNLQLSVLKARRRSKRLQDGLFVFWVEIAKVKTRPQSFGHLAKVSLTERSHVRLRFTV